MYVYIAGNYSKMCFDFKLSSDGNSMRSSSIGILWSGLNIEIKGFTSKMNEVDKNRSSFILYLPTATQQ